MFAVKLNMQGYSEGALYLGCGFPIFISKNIISRKKVPQRQELWALMTSCQLSSILGIPLQQKDKMLSIFICIRKTIVPIFWRIMVRPRAEYYKAH